MKILQPKQEILVASGNQHKILEFRTILKDYPLSLLSPADISARQSLAAPPIVDESADTYLGNARLKARAYFEWSSMAVLADDSGLEVEDLENRPGLYSARYAGEGASDSDKMDKVLAELSALEQQGGELSRRACFRCALVVIDSQGQEYTSESKMPGTVLREKVGTGGFGYDPIIQIDSLGKSLAELQFEDTCKVGFRAEATIAMFARYFSK